MIINRSEKYDIFDHTISYYEPPIEMNHFYQPKLNILFVVFFIKVIRQKVFNLIYKYVNFYYLIVLKFVFSDCKYILFYFQSLNHYFNFNKDLNVIFVPQIF